MMIEKKFLVFISLIYFSLVIGLSNFFLFERGINYEKEYQRCSEALSTDFNLTEEESELLLTDMPRFVVCHNGAYSDEVEYIKIAAGLEAKEPFSLRPLVPYLVGKFISPFAEWETNKIGFLKMIWPVSLLFNILLLSIGGFILFLIIRNHTEDQFLSLILPSIYVVNIGALQTINFLMLDIPSYLLATIAIYFTWKKNYLWLAFAISIGILIKEVLILYTVCFALIFYEKRKVNVQTIFICLLPFVTFVLVRILSNTDPLSIQGGWDIAKGEIYTTYLYGHFRDYGINFFIRFFSALGFPLLILSMYFKNFQHNKFYVYAFIFMLISMILANLLLASRVPRVVFIIYPFIAFIIAKLASNKGAHQIR